MQSRDLHTWDVTPEEAVRLQRELAKLIQASPLSATIRVVAGVDVSYQPGTDTMYAGIVVVELPDYVVLEMQSAQQQISFPYIPGLLSFREIPVVLQAFQRVSVWPEVILCDGQGIAHPRRLGIASHLGLLLDCPSIGCAKSRLYGRYDAQHLGEYAGSSTPLSDPQGAIIGAVVRTKTRTNPVFVSPGFRADVSSAVDLVLRCCRGYKLPEPTRLAHQFVNQVRHADDNHAN